MKKIVILALFVLSQLTVSASAIGVNVGVSAQIGVAEASGSESENSSVTKSETEELLFGTGSFFIEKTLGFLPGPLSRLTVGYDYVPHDVGTGTATNTRHDLGAAANAGKQEIKENNVSANFEDLNTVYLTFSLTDWLYLKAGSVSVDAISTESLGTGSAYGNASLDGEMYGFGINQTTDNGIFFRVEYNVMDLDGVTLTSTTNSDNSVTLNGIDVESARASIGKSF